MPKRIILMYISEISGHHSATIAIENAIKILAPDTEIININAFHYTNPISEKVINKLYLAVIKNTPQIWDYLYDNPRVVRKLQKIKQTIHKFNSPKIKNLIDDFKPDIVCCTQAFPCGMVADYKKIYSSKLPLAAVLTDFIPHAYWLYDTVDFYITPSEEVGTRLIQRGVTPAKIRPYGIPCDPKFSQNLDKKSILNKLNLNDHLPVILVMGGGQGLGPIKTIISSLEKSRVDFQEIVVTGNNKNLFNSLKNQAAKGTKKPILPLGYVNNVDELMTVSDLVITKPGGITTAEALTKKLPMLIIKPIPGQEANNAGYLTMLGAAIKVDDLEKTHEVIDDLFLSTERLESLRKSAAKISKPNASFDIAKLLLQI